MKKTNLFASGLLAAVLMAGCAQNAPVPSDNNIMEADSISGETITMIEEGQLIEEGGVSVSGLSGRINSSADGFESAFFAFDSYAITPEMEKAISRNARNAKGSYARISVEGNCDSHGTDEYNYALGLKRAKAIKDALVGYGVSSERMVMVSYGEANPACTDSTKRCFDSNRRVDLKLIK